MLRNGKPAHTNSTQTLNGDNTTQHITVNINGAQNPMEIGPDVRDAISGSRPGQRENARQYAQLNRMGNDDF